MQNSIEYKKEMQANKEEYKLILEWISSRISGIKTCVYQMWEIVKKNKKFTQVLIAMFIFTNEKYCSFLNYLCV